MTLLQSLFHDENGDAAIQHALVAAVVSIAVLAGSLALRGPVIDLYTNMGDKANAALTGQTAGGSLPERNGGDAN